MADVKLYSTEEGEALVRWIKETESAVTDRGIDAINAWWNGAAELEKQIIAAGHRNDIADSLFWHALVGSHIPGGVYRDFEGELSIVEFVKKLRRDHLGETEGGASC